MSYRYQITEHDGIDCLHVMSEAHKERDGIAHTYIPLANIQQSVNIYNGMNGIEGEVQLVRPEKELAQKILGVVNNRQYFAGPHPVQDIVQQLKSILEIIAGICQGYLSNDIGGKDAN